MFTNRVRLPFYLRAPQWPTTRNSFRKADGSIVNLSVVVEKTYQGVTDSMTKEFHEKLVIALSHDNVTIEGQRLDSGVVLDGDYQVSWNDFLDNPIAPAQFQVKVTPFAEVNDNCATCDSAQQLNLVDDTFPNPIGDAGETQVNVLENDTICCFPIDAELIWFDPTYISTAILDGLGGLTVTAVAVVPVTGSIKIASYRVTCPDGSYDEADVYATFDGSGGECAPVTGLTYTHIDPSEITVESDEVSWAESGTFDWQLFECSDLGTPIDSGTTTDSHVTFLSLDPGACYVFAIVQVCEGSNSTSESIEFDTPAPESLCGRFTISCDDGTPNRVSYNYTYMPCSGGELVTRPITNLTDHERCMLTDSDNDPIYISADPAITINYIGAC